MMKLKMKHIGEELCKVYKSHVPVMSSTYFIARPQMHFNGEK